MLDAAVEAARDVEGALVVREEARTLTTEGGAGVGRERVREAHAVLRAPAAKIADPEPRAELLGAGALLMADSTPSDRVRLAPREVDVPSGRRRGGHQRDRVRAAGRDARDRQGYLRSAMPKLRARTGGEAVVAARRAGWLP